MRHNTLSKGILQLLFTLLDVLSRFSAEAIETGCNQQGQRVALLSLYNATGGAHWTNSANWPAFLLTTGAINQTVLEYFIATNPVTTGMCNTQRQEGVAAAAEAVAAAYGLDMAPSVLPDHCCWFGVSCCTPSTCYGVPPSACNCTYGMVTALYLSHNNLSGNTSQSLEPSIQALSCSLTSLELHKNQLVGTIPTAVTALTLLSNLNLAFNNLTGTIPATLGNMASLQSLALTSNRITGTLPSELCKLGPNSPLNNLYLSRNLLTGTLNISTCGNLYFIDGATNYFSGEPVGLEEYNHLQVANFSENNFTGILFGIHLVQVDFSLNPNINTTFPPAIIYMPFLSTVELHGTNISGTIPAYLPAYLDLTSYIDASNNYISGSLPTTMGDLFSLSYLNFYNNSLTGSIPPSLVSTFARPGNALDLRLTYMSCCGVGFQANEDFSNVSYQYYNLSAPRLPPGLAFSTYLQPVSTSGQLLNQSSGALLNLGNTSYPGLSCPYLRGATDPNEPEYLLNWLLDPEYTLFEGCTCAQGTHTVTHMFNGLQILQCVADTPSSQTFLSQRVWLVAIIAAVGSVLLLSMIWALFLRKRSRRIIKQLEDKRKGSKPVPTHGIMSVVVAEIEGFTALMKRSPDLMLRALVTYNSVLLKAKSVNFGHVIEQEGDSYTFVFEDPVDAVKFCLQVQLLLAKQRWPRGLFRDVDSDDINNSGKGSGNKSNLTAASGGVRSMLTGVNQRMKRMVHDNRVGQADFSLDSTGSGNLTNDGDSSLAKGTLSSEGPNRANPTFKRLTQAGSLNVTGPGSSIYARTTIQRYSQRTTSVPNASTAASREPSGSGLLPTVSAGGVHGLRVRTGVAAGLVKAGFGVIGCALHQRAKLISDAGSGGQILMCEASFAAVKDKTQELGCMTEEGLDLELLEDYGWWSKWWRSKESAKSKGAILLDMGEYMRCPEGTEPPLIMCPKDSQTTMKLNHYALQQSDDEATQGMDPKQKLGSADSRRHSQVALGSLSSQAQPMSSQNGGREGSFAKSSTMSTQQPYDPKALMRIYQVLAPSQELRGIMFGNMMALKEEWVCVDDSYYNAPGIVPFTTNITEVTCVFCQVDNGKQFAARHRQDALLLGLELVCILRSVARQINGSYFVKQQDSDLKYMFVFSKAEDALLWCLSVQFCVLYSDWPASVLHHWPEEHGADGRLLFRGPRLKMGVCTGTPSSIIPDHMGRADYLGPCINMAARFMDAAAHGGQIACTMQQAFDAVYSWSNWARFSSVMQPVHSSSKGQSGHGAGGRDNGLSHDKVTELEPDPSHPAPEWMLEPIVEAMHQQGHAHQPHGHDTFVSDTTKNHTKVDQTSHILPDEVKAERELLSQEKHAVELSSEEELQCKSDHAAGFLIRQTESEKVKLSNGVFDELKNAASLDYRASSTPSLHLHRPSTLGEGEGVEAGQQVGGEGCNSMLRTSCIGSISVDSVERESECEDSCEVGRDEAGKYRVPAVVLTGGPVGESSRDNEASVNGVGMNPSHGRALAQSREEEEQEVVRSYDDGRDNQVGVVQDRWADASSSKVKEDEDMVKRQRHTAGAGAGAGMEVAEHAQANKASTFFSTGVSASSIQTERDKLMLRPSMPLGTGPSAASKTQRAVNNALTARKSLPLGNLPTTISTSINLMKGQSVPLPRISRPSFLPTPAVRGTSLPTPSSSGPVEGMLMGPPQQQGAHEQFHAEEVQEELHRSVLNTIVDGGCEEDEEAVQDLEDITWWAPVDNVVPGRWLDVTVYWTGRYLFKGSSEALTMVNVTPAWLCERRYPEESPKGKGMILSILQGEASTSLVPLLKVVEAYREFCPVPHLPHIGLDTPAATVAHSLATSRVAISRIPSGRTARSSPAFSGDGSARSIDATSGADTSAFKLIKRTFLSVTRRLSDGMSAKLNGDSSTHSGRPAAFSIAGDDPAGANSGSMGPAGANSGSMGLASLRDDSHAAISRRHFLAAQQASIQKRAAGLSSGIEGGMFERTTWDAGEASSVGGMVPVSELHPGQGGRVVSSGVVFVPRSV